MTALLICRKHGELLEAQVIRAGKVDDRQLYKCKECRKEIRRKNYDKNKDKILSSQKLYKKNNLQKVLEIKRISNRKYHLRNKEKRNLLSREYDKKNRLSVSIKRQVEYVYDSYAKQNIGRRFGLKQSQVSDDYAARERDVILIKRSLAILKKIINIKKDEACQK
jgi:hypothetical protein